MNISVQPSTASDASLTGEETPKVQVETPSRQRTAWPFARAVLDTPAEVPRSAVPALPARIGVACVLAMLTAFATFVHLRMMHGAMAYDFTWPWRAVHLIRVGANPYVYIRGVADFPFNWPFMYPMPAAIVAWPVAALPPELAAGVFSGVSSGLLAFGLTQRSWHRLILLASPAFLATAFAGQWSTLMMAGALIPWLSWVGCCKPTAAIAVLAAQRSWLGIQYAVIGGMVMAAICFLVWPTWVQDYLWLRRAGEIIRWYTPIVTLTGGPILLLAALRWRRPEARFLLGIALTPHLLVAYTGFYAMLVGETRRECLALSALSVLALCVSGLTGGLHPAPVLDGYSMLAFLFVPALVIVLRRPNVAPR